MNTCAWIAMHSCGRSGAIGWMRMNSGASRFAQSSRLCARARTRSIPAAVSPCVAGYITSHVNGARLPGSSLTSPCRCVVPVRGSPMMNTGSATALPLDLGMRTALCLEQQQILEQAHDELAHGDAAERRELGLVAIRLQQPLERLVDRPRAEVAHAGAPARGLEQAIDLERGRIGADASQSSAACVQGTRRRRSRSSRKSSSVGLRGFASIRGADCPPRSLGAAMTLSEIQAFIRDVPDFPKPGIVFKDITPLLADANGFRAAIDAARGPCRRHSLPTASSRSSLAASSSALRSRSAPVCRCSSCASAVSCRASR